MIYFKNGESVNFLLFLFFKFKKMKKIIAKFFDFLIKLIEKYEDYKYWYHIDLNNWKYQVWDYIIK